MKSLWAVVACAITLHKASFRSRAEHGIITSEQPATHFNTIHRPKDASSLLQTHAGARVHFMFLVYNRINNEATWRRFFRPAPDGSYAVYVHCKEACAINLPGAISVPRVFSQYCLDLVSPMISLTREALKNSASSRDHFVFISDSTLPIKPFRDVYNAMISPSSTSSFCIFPSEQWAKHLDGEHVLVKHHQWVSLSKEHAEKSVAYWDSHREKSDISQEYHLNWGTPPYNEGCVDELWHFKAIFGSIRATVKEVILEGMSGKIDKAKFHDRCDTFVAWQREAINGKNTTFVSLTHDLIAKKTLLIPSPYRPGHFEFVNEATLQDLRHSQFLFARKIIHAARVDSCDTLEDEAERMLFQNYSVPRDESTFGGFGLWIDTEGNSVSVRSKGRAVEVYNPLMYDWNGVGSACGRHLEINFKNGFTIRAQVSADGQTLAWENGSVWRKAALWLGDGFWRWDQKVVKIESMQNTTVWIHCLSRNCTERGSGTMSSNLSTSAVTINFRTGRTVSGSLSADFQKLLWSDGNVWIRTIAPPCECDRRVYSAPVRKATCVLIDGDATKPLDSSALGRTLENCTTLRFDPRPITTNLADVSIFPTTELAMCDFNQLRDGVQARSLPRLLQENTIPDDYVVVRMPDTDIATSVMDCLASYSNLVDVLYVPPTQAAPLAGVKMMIY